MPAHLRSLQPSAVSGFSSGIGRFALAPAWAAVLPGARSWGSEVARRLFPLPPVPGPSDEAVALAEVHSLLDALAGVQRDLAAAVSDYSAELRELRDWAAGRALPAAA